MTDIYKSYTPSLSSPAMDGVDVSPDDTTVLPQLTRALYVGTFGDVTVRLASGVVVTLGGVQGGVIYPLRVDMVLASGTTATGLVGLW